MNPKKQKKRVLILSHHFLPDSVIAIHRPLGYLRYLNTNHIETSLVTFSYERDETGGFRVYPEDQRDFFVEELQDKKVWRVTRRKSKWKYLFDWIDRFRLLRYFKLSISLLFGFVLNANHALDSYLSFKSFLKKHLENGERYDAIVAICFPFYHIRLANYVYKKFNIPFVVDVKDFLWDNRLTERKTKWTLKEKFGNFCLSFWTRKWLGNAQLLTASSEEWVESLRNFGGKRRHLVSNGFDEESQSVVSKFSTFTIGYLGGLKSNQNIDVFVEGVKLFISSSQQKIDFEIALLGSSGEKVEQLKEAFPTRVKQLPRSNRKGAYKFAATCQLLWFPCADSAPGWIADKIYDYLQSDTPILMAPGDGGVMERIVQNTGTGIVIDDADRLALNLEQKYHEWLRTGSIQHKPNLQEIMTHSRVAQVNRMGNFLQQSLGE